MGVQKFVNGHAVTDENKVIYFIPKFTGGNAFPVDVTVLEVLDTSETRVTGRKSYEGYKVNITADMVENWGALKDSADTDAEEENVKSILLRNLRNAFNCSESFEVKLGSPKETPRKLEFWKKGKGKGLCFGRLGLETIELVTSIGRLLETIVFNLSETSELNFKIQMSSDEIQAKQSGLESDLKNLIKEKSRMEDRMCRAFMKTLNAKKQKITELLKENAELKRIVERQKDEPGTSTAHQSSYFEPQKEKGGVSKSSKNNRNTKKDRVVEIVNSSDSEKSNAESVTDYESETDVNDSDEGKDRVASTSKSPAAVSTTTKNIPSLRRKSVSKSPVEDILQKERRSKCAQKLFVTDEPGTSVSSLPTNSVSDSSVGTDRGGETSKQLPELNPKPDKNIQWSQSESESSQSQELFPKKKRRTAPRTAGKPIPSSGRYNTRTLRIDVNKNPTFKPADASSTSSSGVTMNPEIDGAEADVPSQDSQSKRKKPKYKGLESSSNSPMDDDERLAQIFDFD